jgi:hypothetical protein
MPLREIRCDDPHEHAALLRSLVLEKVNGKPAAEFWNEAGPRR